MNNLEIIKDKFKKDSYAKEFGVVLDELTEDSIKMHMKGLKTVLKNILMIS